MAKVVKTSTARAKATPGESYKIVGKQAKLGTGKRFETLTQAIGKRGGVDNPAAVAAAIGRKKYGAKKMAGLATKGKK
jgi:uncharacterized protein YbjT (DUF2867 family)